MEGIFSAMERFAPEAMEMMADRYRVLRQVIYHQPVGRRQLAKNLRCPERWIRTEIEGLRARGLIEVSIAGICLTPYGEEMLREIDEIVPWLFNIQSLGEKIKDRFALDEVIIVPGDSCREPQVKVDLGRAAAEYLRKSLFPGCILAVTGGTTLAQVANMMRPGIDAKDICVVPARGGLGEQVELQAGNIAAKIAGTLGAQYRLLHIPDYIETSTAAALKKDVHISEVIQIIKSADILVHGIGAAWEMAEKRGLSAEQIAYLQNNAGVGEALRYYFDRWGKIIFELPGVGLDREDLENIKTIVAVAGGSNKAEAIKAVLRNGRENVLVTDEGAAQQIIYGKGVDDDG